jgi:enamine deaminase RidA (YjgF/YER057c/UK114 family)
MTVREPVYPAGRHQLYDAHGYSPAIKSGDFLFVSGQVGSRDDGSPEPDYTDPETQFEPFLALKSEAFPEKPYPNWTAIGVNWLAGFDFEIKVIARIPTAA